MSFYLFLILTVSALGIALARDWSSILRLFSLPLLLGGFVVVYMFVDDQVAQDRGSYFQWYVDAAPLFYDPAARDQLFSALLMLFPEGLPPQNFGALFGGLIFGAFLCTLCSLAIRRVITWDAVPLIAMACLCDRLFLDMTLNASRSSLAAIIFVLGLTVNSRLLRVGIFLLAFGVHSRFVVLLMLVYFSWMVVQGRPRLLKLVVGISVLLFMIRLITGSNLAPGLSIFDFFLAQSESESVNRGLTSVGGLTVSIAVQMIVGLLVPMFLAISRFESATGRFIGGELRTAGFVGKRVLGLALGSCVLALALYPDLSLAHRLFVVVIPFLLIALPVAILRWLALFKFVVLLAFLPSHMA